MIVNAKINECEGEPSNIPWEIIGLAEIKRSPIKNNDCTTNEEIKQKKKEFKKNKEINAKYK